MNDAVKFTVRDMVDAFQVEMAAPGLLPARAREILIQLTALYGNCLEDQRRADHAYSIVLLKFLDSNEAANRAKIRAQTSVEYLEKIAAENILKSVLESMRSLKSMLNSLDTEMRLAR